MTKLHNLTLIDKENFRDFRFQQFLQTDLGKIWQTIPFESLADLLPARNSVGAPNWLPRPGFMALMFLKAYLNLSDEKLIERLNTDWAMQYFCFIQLHSNEQIRDVNLPSRIRSFMANHITIRQFQQVLVGKWGQYIENKHCMFNDATVYESYIKFPTDVKLLWDCCKFVFEFTYSLCKQLCIRRPKSKYKEQINKQLAYQKSKRKSWKKTQKRKEALLYLLNKGLEQLSNLQKDHLKEVEERFVEKIHSRLETIRKVYEQQKYMFDNHTNVVADRIVSLFKPYLRPIVRGKETKNVEFGAKVMVSQSDGIDWIDHLSFDAYNESVYLKSSIINHKERFGVCSQIGIDQIYGTNANRSWMKVEQIFHSLKPKGKLSKNEEQYKKLRKELGRERATVLEGTFGNQKNHYGLAKVKARTEANEKIWILFAIHTANAVKISNKREKAQLENQRQQKAA